MKQRRVAIALILLLCATALLTGTLLILHADHVCHQIVCPICAILTRDTDPFMCLFIAFAGAGLLSASNMHYFYSPAEDQFVPVWTPIRRKVKLQD